MRTLTLHAIDVGRHSAALRFGLGELVFSTTYWYEGVDFHALAGVYGAEAVQRLLFHVAAFEAAKLCSLRPDRLELGAYAKFWTPALATLWRAVLRGVWAQWRHEHDDPDYEGPAIAGGADEATPLVSRAPAPADTLLFCGGGKDSLAAMRLLERAGVTFDTLGYSSSIYGSSGLQHGLIDGLVARGAGRRHFRQWIFDDFLDAPITRLHPELGVRSLTAAETPCSIFAALPIALQHGHRAASLAHERSADAGQLVWARTGEDVNHQWGKSAAAEAMIGGYIARHLLAEFAYHSVLKPIHDLVIFALLRRDADDVAATHSCNLRKPWCMRCPKCLYVWLGCAAFLPRAAVVATFGGEDLLADAGRTAGFLELAGLDGRQPFECIGRPEEVLVYLAVCARRGYAPVDRLRAAVPGRGRLLEIVERYTRVEFAETGIPGRILERIRPGLVAGGEAAREFLSGLLDV